MRRPFLQGSFSDNYPQGGGLLDISTPSAHRATPIASTAIVEVVPLLPVPDKTPYQKG